MVLSLINSCQKMYHFRVTSNDIDTVMVSYQHSV